MYAVEKKYEIEMKLKKELSNIQDLKAAAKQSSSLANDVCNVLGACEQRLQQLENAVLPLYGDTARLQHIHQNMERTVNALDNVINFYMVSREMADMIQAGPHTTSTESLNIYLEALDKLTEAQTYFNKNNPQSVELENINQLYNTGVLNLENAFEELLSRNTRPLTPSTLMDMIALEEDSSVDSISVSGSNSTTSSALETLRGCAAWLSSAGRPQVNALITIRSPAVKTSLLTLIDHLASGAIASPLARTKNMLHRSDSAKKTSKIQKVLEKRANRIMMRASQTLEQSTGLAIGSRRSMNDSYTEESNESMDDRDAEIAGTVAVAVCRIARHEQRHLLGLVPLPKLLGVLQAVLAECFTILNSLVQKACARARRAAGRCCPSSASCWALHGALQRLPPDADRGLQPLAPLQQHIARQCIKCLEDWLDGVRNDRSSGSVDGTVHQLAAATLQYCHDIANNSLLHSVGQALSTEPSYVHAVGQLRNVQDKDAAYLSIFMRKVLAQLNLALRNKSEQYPDALKAIFLLNNTLYLLQGLQRSGLIEVLMIAEPECETSYKDMIQEYKNSYLQSWNKLLSHLSLDEPLPAKLRDKDRQVLKDKFSSFNREWEECTKAQRSYSVPDPELREALKRDNKQTILPTYTAFFNNYGSLPFSKNLEKYLKYTPVQISAQLDGYFDEAA